MAEAHKRRAPLRKDRPSWTEKFISYPLKWKLYDSKTDRIKFARADSQREAIRKALEFDIVPRKTEDVAPQQGGTNVSLMSPREFSEFMQSLRRDG